MGVSASSHKRKDPPKVVLVPPLFERNFKGRSRFTKSSYDYMFCKRPLKWLCHDYLDGRIMGKLYLSPSADPRLSVKAKLGLIDGTLSMRFQPDPKQEGTFVDIRASPQKPGDAMVRMTFLDINSGVGVFGRFPVARHLATERSEVGVRYSSPTFSAGAIMRPHTTSVTHLWLAGRYQALSLGVQVQPNIPLSGLLMNGLCPYTTSTSVSPPSLQMSAITPEGGLKPSSPEASAVTAVEALVGGSSGKAASVSERLQRQSSVCLAYSPDFNTATGKGSFTAAAEVVGGHSLTISFYQHLAATRNVYNPIEKADVVGITNYLDLGIQLKTALSEEGEAVTQQGIQIAGSWQVNRCVLLKGRVGSDSAAVALGLKSWSHPSVSLAACAQYVFGSWEPRLGLYLQIENYGQLQFERANESFRRGLAVTQEHEATEEDIASATGSRVLVMGDGKDTRVYNPVPPVTASML